MIVNWFSFSSFLNAYTVQLLVHGNLHETVERFVAHINKEKQQEILRDPLTPFFEHSPQDKIYTLGHAPAPGSDGFSTNDARYQLMHFFNAEQHLIHNIASVIWYQAVQDQRTENLAMQVFRAAIIQTPHTKKDIAIFEKPSDEHDEAALSVTKILKAAEPQLDPLEHFNQSCQQQLIRPLSQSEFEEFCRNDQERDETTGENYEAHGTTVAAVDATTGANDTEDDSQPSFRGHCVDCIDLGIPRGYRTMIITHPKVKGASTAKATLPYAVLNDNESLAEYFERVGEDDLVEVGIKMTTSYKTIKAQSFAINALKCISQVDLIKAFHGIANIIDEKAVPNSSQKIFDELPQPMQACLTDLRKSIARLHFIAGVAGSAKSYLMEVLILFAIFRNGLDNLHKLKILLVINNNVGIETFCKRLSRTFRDWEIAEKHLDSAFNIMRLYPLEGEVRSAVAEAIARQDDVEETSMAEEFVTSEVIQSLYAKVSRTKSAMVQSKNFNRDKPLHQFATRTLEQDSERHSDLKERLVKELYRQTLQDFSGVVASTPVGITPLLIRESSQPNLVIVDEATTMDEMSLLIPIAHFSPNVWVIAGGIAQKPPHITMEHDLGPGKTTSNPFASQKQTSLLHRVIEGGACHSNLLMNLRAYNNVVQSINFLYYNGIMQFKHNWIEINALKAITAHFQANVDTRHPGDQCTAQVEFTHARVTTPPSSTSKDNSTHAKWHDLGPGKTTSNPFASQEQTSLLHRVVEAGGDKFPCDIGSLNVIFLRFGLCNGGTRVTCKQVF
ncbi:hypothetical protein FGRMN_10714 [Fusarium graminum]|nr:hypothetical protein FGRMN_10714 [Fusarium graminum]